MGVSGQRHAPALLYPQGNDPGTHCIGGWVGPRAGLDTEARGKILCVCQGSNPGRTVCSQTLYWLHFNIIARAVSICNPLTHWEEYQNSLVWQRARQIGVRQTTH